MEYDRKKQGLQSFIPSRLFIYYNERFLEGSINDDAGAEIKDGIKTVASDGYCDEALWPFDIAKITTKPPTNLYNQALKYKAISYYSIDNTKLIQLKTCLAAGYPVIFGSTIYESFYNADKNHGVVPMPHMFDKVMGGHCILIVGYDDNTSLFTIRNSWGTSCGDGTGHYFMPYNYITNKNLTDDVWSIRTISNK